MTEESIIATMEAFSEIGQESDLIEKTKLGIDAVKGSGSELNSIIEAFMKFKTTKEEKLPDIDTVKGEIAKMVTFSADLFNYLGGGESEVMEGLKIPKIDIEQINKGKDMAIALSSSMSEIGKIFDEIQKFKDDDGTAIKTLTSQYKEMVNVLNSNDFVPGRLGEFRSLVAQYKNLSELINSTNIESKKLNQYATVVNSIEKLSSASKGFTEFEKSYDKFEKNFKKTRDGINGIDLPKFQAYNRMLELHVDLAKISRASDINKMTEGMREFMKEFADGLVLTIEKMGEATHRMEQTYDQSMEKVREFGKTVASAMGQTVNANITGWSTQDTVIVKNK